MCPLPVPEYRRPLTVRPDFVLFGWQSDLRDLGGGLRARAHAPEDDAATERVVTATTATRQHEDVMPWSLRLRHARLLVQPVRAVESRHLWFVVLYFSSLLVAHAALFTIAAFLACTVSAAADTFSAVAACAIGAMHYFFYVGGVGPFACGTDGGEEDGVPGEAEMSPRRRLHKYLPARFPLAVGVSLTAVTVASILLAVLSAREVATRCALSDRIYVSAAPSYSNLVLHSASGTTFNDGSALTDASSSRAFFVLRDGAVDAALARGINVSDLADGSTVASSDDAATTRMLLVAPIFPGTTADDDPLFERRVPAWAVGSFAWSDDASELTANRNALEADWSASYRFGIALGSLDDDYSLALHLVASILSASDDAMLQFAGAPLLRWQSDVDLAADATSTMTLLFAVAAVVITIVWSPVAIAHVWWYTRMIAAEAAFREEAARRGGSGGGDLRTTRVVARDKTEVQMQLAISPPHAGAIHMLDGVSHAGVESADSPSSLRSPSASTGSVELSVCSSPSSSNSDAALLSSRPASASVSVSGAHSWRARLWRFGGSTRSRPNSISPNPLAAVVPPTTATTPTASDDHARTGSDVEEIGFVSTTTTPRTSAFTAVVDSISPAVSLASPLRRALDTLRERTEDAQSDTTDRSETVAHRPRSRRVSSIPNASEVMSTVDPPLDAGDATTPTPTDSCTEIDTVSAGRIIGPVATGVSDAISNGTSDSEEDHQSSLGLTNRSPRAHAQQGRARAGEDTE